MEALINELEVRIGMAIGLMGFAGQRVRVQRAADITRLYIMEDNDAAMELAVCMPDSGEADFYLMGMDMVTKDIVVLWDGAASHDDLTQAVIWHIQKCQAHSVLQRVNDAMALLG